MAQRDDASISPDEAAREFDWATLPPFPSARTVTGAAVEASA